MHKKYNLGCRLIACVLLVNLFFQGCTGVVSNSNIPNKGREIVDASSPALQNTTKELLYHELIAQGGHLVILYEEGEQLQADVEVGGLDGFSKTYTGFPVYIHEDTDPGQLVRLHEKRQQQAVEVHFPTSNRPGYVYVGSRAIRGGMKRFEKKEKEKEKEKEKDLDKEIGFDTFSQSRNSRIGAIEKGVSVKAERRGSINKDFANFQPPLKGPRLFLSLDGGGIRGILEAYLLHDLEETIESNIKEHFNDPTAPAPDVRLGECFDLIAGTSTGGIIALAMRILDPETNRPKLKMRDILALYEDKGEIIFPSVSVLSGIWGAKFTPQPLENLFKEYFGETSLKDLMRPTVIAAYDVLKEGVHLFTNYKAQRKLSDNFALKDVARATSAAPTYFPAAVIKDANGGKHVFVDGGVEANNPTLHAYVEAKECFPQSKWHIISLGTGNTHLFTPESKESGGILQWGWGGHIINLLMNSSSNTIQDLTPKIAKSDGNEYTRLQFELDNQVGKLDNAGSKNIRSLKGYAKRTIEGSAEFVAIKDILLDFYEKHGFYVFHNLVDWALSQLEDKTGQINLSNCYLTERALWEITHALQLASNIEVSHLDLSKNDLSKLSASTLSYLKQLGGLKVLNLSNTHLGIEALKMLKTANLNLEMLRVCNNPTLIEAADEQLINCTERYGTTYFDPILHQRLGKYHERGGEEAKAIKLYGDCEDPTTQLALAELYLRKKTDDPIFELGFSLLQRLADQGYVEAQYILGHIFERSETDISNYLRNNILVTEESEEMDLDKRSFRKAVYWYKLAAEQQHKNAANALARLYEDRKIIVPVRSGQPRDERHQIEEALKYYRIAKAAGSASADKNIRNLEDQLKEITKCN